MKHELIKATTNGTKDFLLLVDGKVVSRWAELDGTDGAANLINWDHQTDSGHNLRDYQEDLDAGRFDFEVIATEEWVRVLVKHRTSNKAFSWVDPVGWAPGNVLLGTKYEEGSWFDDHGEVAALAVRNEGKVAGSTTTVLIDDLVMMQSGTCRILNHAVVKGE